MENNIVKKWKKIGMIGWVWMFVFGMAICGSWRKNISAQVASQKNKAVKAYRKFLEKQSKIYSKTLIRFLKRAVNFA